MLDHKGWLGYQWWARWAALLIASMVALAPQPAHAHQPFFEEPDTTSATPWVIADPTVSLALYFTLSTPTDVDYVVFDGRASQSLLLSMTIPQIAGQEDFTPTLALIGPGLPAASLPKAIVAPAGNGALIIRAEPGKPVPFFEPFSATAYWRRQRATVTLPADGQYIVALWSETGQTGRYTFAPGTREVFGGDREFRNKLSTYWTPVPTPAHRPSQFCEQ
jgi:hypothetical protein